MTPEELLKEVGEPVAARRKVAMWQGGDDYKYEWVVVKEHTPGTEPLYTSDQVAAAVLKATKPLEVSNTSLQSALNEALHSKHELRKQLAAAQGENEHLRIALDCTNRDLVRMRCPDFFEGVKDGYETLFDGHLVNMIGLINDYAKQK